MSDRLGVPQGWECPNCHSDALWCKCAESEAARNAHHHHVNQPTPGKFEAMRKLLQDAADQLAKDMEQQPQNYPMAGDVLSLLYGAAQVTGLSIWQQWESWAVRHVLPVYHLVHKTEQWSDADIRAMDARVRDLLGYCILGLAINEQQKRRLT